MDAHPYYPNILLICQADGHILLFDMFIGCVVNTFQERGYHISHPQFQLIPTECRFTKDGLSFIVATQYGSISLYGYDDRVFFVGSPVEQFFKSDFEGFTIDPNTMKALAQNGDESGQDMNCYPRGSMMSLNHESHPFVIKINPTELLREMSRMDSAEHIPQVRLDGGFMKKIGYNLREAELKEQLYSKTYEEV